MSFAAACLKTLPGMDTRPTPDRLRESLFNILAPEIEGVVFLDAYAGTGAVGIEALSRGAAKAIFIERSRAAAGCDSRKLAGLGLAAAGRSAARAVHCSICRIVRRTSCFWILLTIWKRNIREALRCLRRGHESRRRPASLTVPSWRSGMGP